MQAWIEVVMAVERDRVEWVELQCLVAGQYRHGHEWGDSKRGSAWWNLVVVVSDFSETYVRQLQCFNVLE